MRLATRSGTRRPTRVVRLTPGAKIVLVTCPWCFRILLTAVAHCTNYLCPGTLACVHFPHHCPCAFPAVEDKVELGDGIAVCVSKGGYKVGEAAARIDLARKGLL